MTALHEMLLPMTQISASTPIGRHSDTAHRRFDGVDWALVVALGIIALWALTLAGSIGIKGGWLIDAQGVPQNNDFNNVYTAGKFVLQGEPAAAYDWERHKQSQIALTGNASSTFFPWPYPPMFLFIAALLAALPYAAAMFTWAAGTLALFAVPLARIAANRTQFAVLLAMPAVWLNAFVGQNGAFTAALIGAALFTLPTRPVLSGVFIGLLSYKPHLGVLFPVALIAAGQWRAFVSAGVTVAILVVASLIAFGTAPWLAWPGQLEHVMSIVKVADAPQRLQSLFGLSISLGIPTAIGSIAQSALTLVLIAVLAATWHNKRLPFDLKAALLATAVTLASPYQFVYDLPVLTIAQAFLLRHLTTRGQLSWAVVLWLILVNTLVFLFAATSIPLGLAGCLLLLALVCAQIRTADIVGVAPSKADLPAGISHGRLRVLKV
jgi:arabinofuranan 3-O-arabinosyltransferase